MYLVLSAGLVLVVIVVALLRGWRTPMGVGTATLIYVGYLDANGRRMDSDKMGD